MKKSLAFLDNVPLPSASADALLSNGIPNDYLMWGLYLDVSFRDVIAVAGAASIPFGSPTTFIERITVEGQLLGRGRVTVIDLSGRQLWQYVRSVMGQVGYVNADDLVADAGAIATYDIRIGYLIPFVSFGSVDMERATLLPGNMFSNPLTLRIRRGGLESIAVNAGTTTQTFSAFGSGAGNPSVNVSRIIIREGLGMPQRAPLLCQKSRQGPFTLTSSVTDGLLGRLNVGNLIARLHLQQGTAETDTGQNGELASGSYALVTRYRIKQNQNVIRDVIPRDQGYVGAFLRGVNFYGDAELTIQAPQAQTGGFLRGERVGESLFDFCPDGSLDDALNTVLWAQQGQNLLINGDVVGAANQQLEAITEELSPLVVS
ncbi:MAG: hypothetical protein ACREA9_29000 [Pyrinomonadaceae bacterium]